MTAIDPDLPVLVMSLHSEAQFAVRALRAGAAGYLTKAAAPEQLVIAFEKIAMPVWLTVGSSTLPLALIAAITDGALTSPPEPKIEPLPTIRSSIEIW